MTRFVLLQKYESSHHSLDAVRAHLLETAGDTRAAVTHYQAAAARTTSVPEQRYLTLKAARLKERDAGMFH
jgi:predicted RNA polymerase sigma factor